MNCMWSRFIHSSTHIDLHIHSSMSDGRYPPQEVLKRCALGGLDLVAITDHDLTSSLKPGVHDIEGKQILLLAGAEISGTHEGAEYHLLVYFPGTVPPEFRAFCETRCRHRAERYESSRHSIGLTDLTPADEEARLGQRALTRLHLARELMENGHVSSVQEAFDRYLGAQHQRVPPVNLTFIEAIQTARSCGALTSWAHPSLEDARSHLATFKQAGLHGIEAARPGLRTSQRRSLRKLARAHGLFVTGGSDWHGWHSLELGTFSVDPQQVSGFITAMSEARTVLQNRVSDASSASAAHH